MKTTMEIPDELYRQVKAKSALEGRTVKEVVTALFEHYVHGGDGIAEAGRLYDADPPVLLDGEPVPSWFGIFGRHARQVQRHDMESIRESIAAGIARERGS